MLSVSSHDSQNGDDTADESGSEDELDLDDDIPVTGFAVASTRRNYEFHEMFTNIPEGDYLIEGPSVIVVLSLVIADGFA